MRNFIIYLFPLSFDIVVALSMFVGRHSFAERNAGIAAIGSFAAIYGLVYIPSSFLMGKIVSPARSKSLMIMAIVLMIMLLCLLANITNYFIFLAVFAGIPFGTSLFFNSFQSYMLDIDTNAGKSLSHSVGHYTFAWSVGFALGPIVSYLATEYFNWSAAYYMAALIILIIGIIALLFKPQANGKVMQNLQAAESVLSSTDKALPVSGWIGLIIGVSSFQLVLTYWPIQAEKLHYSVLVKGGVEFSASISQALAALIICLFIRWYHKPLSLLVFGLIGFSGLIAIAFADSLPLFFIGACLFGLYLSSCFIYMVYHSMFDKAKAVKRVSINEIMVGIAILIGPIIATGLLTLNSNDFKHAYLCGLGFFVIGIGIQTAAALKENSGRKYGQTT